MSTWYKKCMPKIKDIKPHITGLLETLKKNEGIKSLYIWGSYAENINNPEFRIRDIDILAKTNINNGDLLSINKNIIMAQNSDDYLEEQGYNPLSIKFSKEFLNLTKYNVDCWAISSDRKLLHWGPVFSKRSEAEELRIEAEEFAKKNTGVNRGKLNKVSENTRKRWHNSYFSFMNKYFKEMPTGWFKVEDIKMKEITSEAIKI